MAQETIAAELAQHVTAEAERLEEIESWEQIGEIDVRYTTDGQYVSHVYLTVATDGPHVEIDALHGIVRAGGGGYYSGEEYSTHFRSVRVNAYALRLAKDVEARLQA